MKSIFIWLSLLLILVSPLEAQRYYWGQRHCWGCRRYMNPALATYDAVPYGYVDNINYPATYALPLNHYFNYCPPCRNNSYNVYYFQNCIQFSNHSYRN